MAPAAARRRANFESKAAAALHFASRTPLGVLQADVLAAYVEDGFVDADSGMVTLACRPEHEAATFSGAAIFTEDIQGLRLDAMIASGVADLSPSAADFAAPTAAALARATHIKCAHLGHLGPLQDPDRIATMAADFLDDPA